MQNRITEQNITSNSQQVKRNYLQELLDGEIRFQDVPISEFTKEIGLELVRKNWEIVRNIPKNKYTDDIYDAIYLEAVRQNAKAFRDVPQDKCTEAIYLEAIRQNQIALMDVPENKFTKAICVEFVRKNWKIVRNISKNKYTDDIYDAIYLEAVRQNVEAFRDVPKDKRTEAICLEAARQDLDIFHKILKDKRTKAMCTKEMCLEVVRQNGKALKSVPEAMRTEEMCLAAIRQNRSALQYVPKEINCSTEEMYLICLEIIRQDASKLKYVPEKLKDRIIQQLSVSTIPAYRYFPKDIDYSHEANQCLSPVECSSVIKETKIEGPIMLSKQSNIEIGNINLELQKSVLDLIQNQCAVIKLIPENNICFMLQKIKDPNTDRPSRAKFYLGKQLGETILKTNIKTKETKSHVVGSGRKKKLADNPQYTYSHTHKTSVTLIPSDTEYMKLCNNKIETGDNDIRCKLGLLWDINACDMKNECYFFNEDVKSNFCFWLTKNCNDYYYQKSSSLTAIREINKTAVHNKNKIAWNELLVGLPKKRIDAVFILSTCVEDKLFMLENMYLIKSFFQLTDDIPMLINFEIYTILEQIKDIISILNTKPKMISYTFITDIINNLYPQCIKENPVLIKGLFDVMKNSGMEVNISSESDRYIISLKDKNNVLSNDDHYLNSLNELNTPWADKFSFNQKVNHENLNLVRNNKKPNCPPNAYKELIESGFTDNDLINIKYTWTLEYLFLNSYFVKKDIDACHLENEKSARRIYLSELTPNQFRNQLNLYQEEEEKKQAAEIELRKITLINQNNLTDAKKNAKFPYGSYQNLINSGFMEEDLIRTKYSWTLHYLLHHADLVKEYILAAPQDKQAVIREELSQLHPDILNKKIDDMRILRRRGNVI